ncbi:hypothetical protein N0V93_000032 [Gnomoniopsis smithogilvyi]|uniref:Uncharacterized protein n=1 Tax=Gnomoniopsis smithogilvyi TaxID=1191159 RepID=A0A9W8Z106_9PEZI|nr:hypothetical protein N0V93_000032 [Gnomoniopsis smithogilvyi]
MWPPFGAPAAFYNQRWVQETLGVPVNFTLSADAVVENFFSATGDPMIPSYKALETIVDAGVGVAFVYGDLDYQCNWLGMENVSLSMDYADAAAFRAAGYAPIHTNASYTGGLVRQYGSVSFSRVFQAGHDTWAYQPETVARIFERAVLGRDIATGRVDVDTESHTNNSSCSAGGGYSSKGPSSVRNVTELVRPPVLEAPLCWWYTADDGQTCSAQQMTAVEDGTAVVEQWVIVSPPSAFSATSGNPAVRATSVATAGS